MINKLKKYDVAFSFAGEDRDYVENVAKELINKDVKVFYDLNEEADLWGKDLFVHLSNIYKEKSQYTVIFISKYYANKLWTNHERKSAQARAFEESEEYILPVRFDDTKIPGILPTTGYIDLNEKTPEKLANLICQKLGINHSKNKTKDRKNFTEIKTKENKKKDQDIVTKPDKLQVEYEIAPTQNEKQKDKVIKDEIKTLKSDFEQLFNFAYSYDGLDKTRIDAKSWALENIKRFENEDINAFKSDFEQLFNFTYSYDGLDKTRIDAKSWALENIKRFENEDINAFKSDFEQLFNFAYSYDGLDKTRIDAKSWALENIKRFENGGINAFKSDFEQL